MPLPDETQIPATMQLALFGPVGVAAYFGLKDRRQAQCRRCPGLAAASAVSCLVGQIGSCSGAM
jgi:NADPH-dependent curcumin reductase CurA